MARAGGSIRARILAAFVLSLAAFTGALGYGLVQLRAIGEGLVAINAGYLPLAGTAADLGAVVRQMDRDTDRLSREGPRPLAGHRANAAFFSTSLGDDLKRAEATVDDALEKIRDPEERAALGAVSEVLTQIQAQRRAFDAASAVWLDLGPTAETARVTGALVEVERSRKELGLQIARLSALVEGRIEAVSERTARAQTRALTVSGTLAALAVGLAGLLAGVALVTLRPIGLLTEQVQRLAAGEAAGQVDVRANDEVGVLAREFNAMAEAVAERDRRLSERAEALDRLSLRLRQVLDTIRAGLIVVEDNQAPVQAAADPVSVAMANPAAERLWGAAEGQGLPEPLAVLMPRPGEGDARARRYEAHALADRLFDLDVVPFGDRGVLVVGEDVTDRNRDQERLARTERLALVGQMLAQITHEVRNPLNAMSLNAELLAEELDDPEASAMLATITAEIRRLEGLTARYLDLSRRRPAELISADPLAVAREVLRLEEEALRRAGVSVTISGTPGQWVDLDGDALRRALRNVVRNAVEAGAKRVAVTVERAEENVVVAVRDDGPGMGSDELSRAFEPFFTTKAKGTGLGLAISRQELEDAGGALRCETARGEGCTFTLVIPGIWEGADEAGA